MTCRNSGRLTAIGIVTAILTLPLLGAWSAGRNLRPVFRFPPTLAIPTLYPQFSWIAAIAVLTPFLALAITWLVFRASNARRSDHLAEEPAPHGAFPWWGWTAVLWVGGWWLMAWTRFHWFAPLQRYTFFPLWLGFIISVNAVAYWRAGTCLMIRSPGRWIRLFAASAVFWWVFEWLNRFAQNWHYLGVADFGAAAYALHATLCFSTVLPAVAAVAEVLLLGRGWRQACEQGPPLRWLASRRTAGSLIVIGVVGLLGTGAMPRYFYPALWAAPLALLIAESVLASRGEIPSEIAVGTWYRAASWSVAALICGVFWELWNVHSAAKWIYTVPYVDRWHGFEMPLLGYLGYLPFGLECYFVTARVLDDSRPFSGWGDRIRHGEPR